MLFLRLSIRECKIFPTPQEIRMRGRLQETRVTIPQLSCHSIRDLCPRLELRKILANRWHNFFSHFNPDVTVPDTPNNGICLPNNGICLANGGAPESTNAIAPQTLVSLQYDIWSVSGLSQHELNSSQSSLNDLMT